MVFTKEILNIFKASGRAGWLSLLTLVMPLIGSTVLIVYLKDSLLLKDFGSLGKLVFVVATLVLVGTSLMPSYIMAIAGGFLFGFYEGGLLTLLGIMLAALLGYGLSRLFVCDKFYEFISTTERYKKLNELIQQQKFHSMSSIIMLMRLSPFIPFAMTNVLLASLKVKVKLFVAGTFAGMLPRTILAVLFGSELLHLDFQKPTNVWFFLFGVLATLALLLTMSKITRQSLKVET